MPTLNSFKWASAVLGEHIQYPGHPLVLACMVMDRYPSLDAACTVDPGMTFNRALGDSFIPGAGCAVHAALDTLRFAQKQGLAAACEHAERYWQGWEAQSVQNAEGAAIGRRQAEKLKALFDAKFQAWGTADEAASPYRAQLP